MATLNNFVLGIPSLGEAYLTHFLYAQVQDEDIPYSVGCQLYYLSGVPHWIVVIAVCLLSMLLCSIGLAGDFSSFEEAWWLAFTAFSSIGFGRLYPQTALGRIAVIIAGWVGPLFPYLFGWVTNGRIEYLRKYHRIILLSEKVVYFQCEVASVAPTVTQTLKNTLGQLVGIDKVLYVGSKRELRRYLNSSRFLWLFPFLWLFVKVKPLGGALAYGESDKNDHSMVFPYQVNEHNPNVRVERLQRDALFEVRRRSFKDFVCISLWGLVVLLTFKLVGALGYIRFEGISATPSLYEINNIWDAKYMTSMVQSTIGFGELVPRSTAGKVWSVFIWILAQLLFRIWKSPLEKKRHKRTELLELLYSNVVCFGYDSILTEFNNNKRSAVLVPGSCLDLLKSEIGWARMLSIKLSLVEDIILAADREVPIRELEVVE